MGFLAVTGVGCALAAVAWASPDSYAPIQNDPSSWPSPVNRANVQQTGATWTIPACVAATAFLASGVYGHNVRPKNDDDDTPGAGWAAAAAFAAGFSAAAQAQPAPTVPQGCSSDFNCGVGYRCVKRMYSSLGVCMKEVDQYGAPTYASPDLDSVGPKLPSHSDCQFDTDCPIGFRCEARSGACFK